MGGYPRFARARSFKVKTRTAGGVTISGSTPTAVDTTLDLTLNCQAGDVLELTVAGLYEGATPSGATITALDAATMNGSTAVNYASSGAGSPATNGVSSWIGPFQSSSASQESTLGGSWWYTVQAGDIFNGLVTLRLFGWASTGTGSRVLNASAGAPLRFAAKNLGPTDPN